MKLVRIICPLFVTALSAHGFSQSFVSARVTGTQFLQGELYDTTVATVSGIAGQRLRINAIAIGGDADINSGDALFHVRSGSGATDFQFVAGQGGINTGMAWSGVGSIAHRLAATPDGAGSARGFSLLAVDYVLEEGEGFDLRFRGTRDWDGRYTMDIDPLGNLVDDSAVASSIRGWVQYEVMPVPEPLTLIGLAFLAPAIRRRRARQ